MVTLKITRNFSIQKKKRGSKKIKFDLTCSFIPEQILGYGGNIDL